MKTQTRLGPLLRGRAPGAPRGGICLFLTLALLAEVAPVLAQTRLPAPQYLSDLVHRISYLQQGWGALGMDTCAHAPGQSPLPLRIGKRSYTRGLGHHAPGRLVVELEGQYQRFEAEVGVQWQSGNVGSVVFQVYVDGRKRFDSGLMRERDPARPVSIPLEGAEELELRVTDGGDGISCDCANWAEARLVPAAAPVRQAKPPVDIARFGQVCSWDPARKDGCQANRIEEFRAEDVFLGQELAVQPDGGYLVPAAADGRGCVGLQWNECRRIRELAVEFAPEAPVPLPGETQVEAWAGESPWQGTWQPFPGSVEARGHGLVFRAKAQAGADWWSGVRKVRWILPPASTPRRVQRLGALTPSRWQRGQLFLRLERPLPGKQGEVEIYNGELVEPPAAGPVRISWDLAKPLALPLRYCKPSAAKADRTVLWLHLPAGACGVAVEDVLKEGTICLRYLGLTVSREAAPTPAKRRQSVLQRVRQLPDQTLAQALARTHHEVQDNGPTMLSLACANQKFVVAREGAIRFDKLEVRPRFGQGTPGPFTRRLEGGWLPVPVTSVTVDGLVYRQRTFVAPYGARRPAAIPWLAQDGLCVAEITVENARSRPAQAHLVLDFLADVEGERRAQVELTARGALAADGGRLVAVVDVGESELAASRGEGTLTLQGSVPGRGRATCWVYIPSWQMSPREAGKLAGGTALLDAVREHWQAVLAPAAQVEVPDPLLMNVIRASQVHCLIAARNEAGQRVAPWIASMSYGPLESESNSIVRGMDLLGHHDFARRSLEFFISRYHPAGFLTTGYTLMGTGWHLWTLGEHHGLTGDREWLAAMAPEVARACQWVVRQRAKTKGVRPDGGKVPEYGLLPPGVMADWNAFAYYFCLNGYYYAGLQAAGAALADIGYPGADGLLAEAAALRREIRRAYRWTQARTPAVALGNGTWVPGYPSQLHCPGPTNDFFPGQDGNRSWAYDVELGAHQLIPQGVLAPGSREARWIMEHMEDGPFLAEGWFDYPASANRRDWFNLGGFSKVQPYYTRNAEICALQDEVKPFLRSYFNTLASLLNRENLSLWEHFRNVGAWNKTHETGYFLQQTRFMLVMERGQELWLAPLVTSNWLQEGMVVAVTNAPTRFGPVSYRISSHAAHGWLEAHIQPPTRRSPTWIVIRLRHPEGKPLRAVAVNGRPHQDFDPHSGTVRLPVTGQEIRLRADYR